MVLYLVIIASQSVNTLAVDKVAGAYRFGQRLVRGTVKSGARVRGCEESVQIPKDAIPRTPKTNRHAEHAICACQPLYRRYPLCSGLIVAPQKEENGAPVQALMADCDETRKNHELAVFP